MILTVTLNPCIDHTAEVDRLLPGATNRVVSSRRDPSGKGINVSIVLRHLGAETLCLGVSRAENGGLLGAVLEQKRIPHDFYCAPGRLRVNLKLFDRSTGVMTECNEKGEVLPESCLNGFLELAERYLPSAKLLVLSGSVPPGVPDTIYRTLGERAAACGVPTVLDASGPLLREGLRAAPVLIKPNLDELRETFGVEAATHREVVQVGRSLLEKTSVRVLCVSMGSDGAILVTKEEAWYSPGSPVTVRGVQGAGDSMVAGLCLGLLHGADPRELLCGAVAAAQGSLEKPGTLLCEREDFDRIRPSIPAEPISD